MDKSAGFVATGGTNIIQMSILLHLQMQCDSIKNSNDFLLIARKTIAKMYKEIQIAKAIKQ